MAKKAQSAKRREDSLTRESIIEAAIKLLDASGEEGLTFRALSEKLATGAGAIYWHVANKDDLITAACDATLAAATETPVAGTTPKATIRALALRLFDMLDEHPWVISALRLMPGKMPMVRLMERLGQQIHALGVPKKKQWAAVSALLHYIFGVGGQNALNRQFGQAHGLVRSDVLAGIAEQWSALDLEQFPFTRSIAGSFGYMTTGWIFLRGWI